MTVLLTGHEIAIHAGSSGTLGIRFETVHGGIPNRAHRPDTDNPITWRGEQRLRVESNYLIGSDHRRWHTNVPHFSQVEASNLTPGVSLAVYGTGQGVEYDLRLAPGTDPSKLRVALEGAQDARLNAIGDLVMSVGSDELTMKKPLVYEEISFPQHSHRRRNRRASRAGRGKAGKSAKRHRRRTVRKPVKAAYILEDDGSIGFRLGPHDTRAVLVIDPSLSVTYATFLGGSGADVAQSIAVDSTGKIYVGGTTTSSTTFSEGLGYRLGPVDGPSEFFIAKIDPTVTGPNSLIYLTFLGGSGKQTGGLIAVDGAGDVAITGTTTATDFPVTDTTQPTSGLTSGYGNDVIVSEIDPTGTKLVFSTLFGGSGAEFLNGTGGIALDSSGNVYVASDTTTTSVDTNSPDLPVTNGAFQTVWDGETGDGFVAVFQPPSQAGGAAALKYCSYLGTNAVGSPGVGGIAVDSSGNAYIAGFAANSASGFPTKNAFQSAYGGGTADAFLMKISALGAGSQDLVYATLLGGSDADEALGVAVDSANPPNAYVTGMTESPDFPVSGATPGFQTALHANATSNAFLAVISQNASTGMTSLVYSTYLGGSATDAGQGVAVTASNAVYVVGSTTSFDFPWRDNLQPFNGAGDAFVAKLDPTSAGAASLIYATPLGGTSPPGGTASASGNAVAADGAGHSYIAGITTSGDFPTAVTTSNSVNGFQQNCSSCAPLAPQSDAFIAQIAEAAGQSPSVFFSLPHLSFPAGSSAPEFVSVLNGGEAGLTISSISITGPDAGDFSMTGQAGCIGPSISPSSAAQCSLEVAFTPSMVGPETAFVSVADNAPGSPQVLELTGAGGNGPLAAVSPSSVNFGSQPENTTASNPVAVSLQNIGNQTLTLASFGPGGADPGRFQIDASSSSGSNLCQLKASLAPGGTCVVQVAFAPTSQGSFQAELDFFDNSGNAANAEQVVKLIGAGIAPAPVASLAPLSLAFGSVIVGASSGSQSVTFTNIGSTALSLSSIGLSGSNAADFTIPAAGTSCPLSGGSLAIGANCTVAVQFTPQTVGSKNASLSFTDNAGGSPQQVSLSGTATAAPSIAVTPSSLTFGAANSQSVTVSNTGNTTAGIGTVSITPATPVAFVVTGNTCTVLAVGGECQITVSFDPPDPGTYSATLNISVSGGNTATVSLSGTAGQASISLPTSVNFGTQLARSPGAPPPGSPTSQPVMVTNNSSQASGGTLLITSATISPANDADFSITADSCTGANTQPGGTCSIQVLFQPVSSCPTMTGPRSATLTISDNAPGSPHTVPLSGTAIDFCVATQLGQGVSEPISAGQSETFMLQIQSSDPTAGSAQLSCSVPTQMPGGCTITTTPATNPPVVQITPTSPGLFQMVVTATSSGATPTGGSRVPNVPPWGHVKRMLWLALVLIAWCVLWRRVQDSDTCEKSGLSVVAMVHACILVLAITVGMAACGGGGATASDPLPSPPQSETYPVTATATITVGQSIVTRTFTESVTIQ